MSWIVWSFGAALYMSGFYQRVAPAVMTDYLMADFKIGAAGLGNFSAFYFYSYVAVQIPTGILADYWGPRKLLTVGAFIAASGAFLFAAAPNILVANIGRLLIGGSVGVGWVALLMLSIHWFPPHRFAMMSGIGLFLGIAGAVSAGVPLRILADQFGWRPVMLASAGVSLIIAVFIWILVRDDPSERGYTSFAPPSSTESHSAETLLTGLRKVLCYKNTWLLSIAPAGIVGPLLAFSGLWGVPFLTTHYGLTPARSAALTSMLLVAWAVGGPLIGALSDRMGRRKPIYVVGCFAICAGWTAVLFVPELPVWVLVFLLSVVGFASGAMILGFAFVKESVPPSLAGTVSGVCNMGVMIGPMVLQPAMGYALDNNWNGLLANGIRIYHLGAYQSAFTLLIGWALISAILTCFTTETGCRQRVLD